MKLAIIQYNNCICSALKDRVKHFFKLMVMVYVPMSSVWVFQLIYIHDVVCVFYFSLFNGCVLVYYCGVNLPFSINKWNGPHFTCFLAIWISFVWSACSRCLPIFQFFFFLLICNHSLHILEMSLCTDLCIAYTFSHSVACILILLIVSIDLTEVLHFNAAQMNQSSHWFLELCV